MLCYSWTYPSLWADTMTYCLKKGIIKQRDPLLCLPLAAWPSSKLAVHWLPLMQDSMVVVVVYCAAAAWRFLDLTNLCWFEQILVRERPNPQPLSFAISTIGIRQSRFFSQLSSKLVQLYADYVLEPGMYNQIKMVMIFYQFDLTLNR